METQRGLDINLWGRAFIANPKSIRKTTVKKGVLDRAGHTKWSSILSTVAFLVNPVAALLYFSFNIWSMRIPQVLMLFSFFFQHK